MDFCVYTPEQMRRWLVGAGDGVEESIEREPYAPDVEHQSRRAYVLARKGVGENTG